MSNLLRGAAALAMLVLPLCACGSYPLPTLYVLGDRTPATPGVVARTGATIIELKPVSAPEDLDSTDIVRRDGANRAIVCTLTARWRVVDAQVKSNALSEEGSFVETPGRTGDAAAAAAMTIAIDKLAAQVAVTVQRGLAHS